jgi:hypothetical protein
VIGDEGVVESDAGEHPRWDGRGRRGPPSPWIGGGTDSRAS